MSIVQSLTSIAFSSSNSRLFSLLLLEAKFRLVSVLSLGGLLHLPLNAEFDNLLIIAIPRHAQLGSHPGNLLHDLLLHEVHAHGEQGHAEDAVGDSEDHLHCS